MIRGVRSVFITAALLALAVYPAQAALIVTVTESGGVGPIEIADNSALDINPLVGVVTFDTAALNLLLFNFSFLQFNATSSPGPVPVLTQSGLVEQGSSGGTSSIEIRVTDTDYLLPAANPKFMDSAASDVWSNTAPDALRTFQSFFGPSNDPNELSIPSPLLEFLPPLGAGPFVTSANAPTTGLGAQPIPFSLTNVTAITFGNLSPTAPQRDQFAGSTSIRAQQPQVPEPGAMTMLLLGVPALLVRRRKRT